MPETPKQSAVKDIFDWRVLVALAVGITSHWASLSFTPGTLIQSLLSEIGTALIVAVFVWGVFELASSRKQEERIDQRIERITKNVFFGVFRKDLPEGLINETSLLVLEANILRKNFFVNYTLTDEHYEADGQQMPYVSLRAIAQFTLKNISVDTATVKIGVGLPNPIHPNMRAKTDVTSITVRHGENDEERLDLTQARQKMREQMADDQKYVAFCTAAERKLEPDEEIMVCADYVMAKETEDTEVLQSLYPTDGIRVTIFDTAPEKRIVRGRAIHRVDLQDRSSPEEPHTRIYSLEHHLLPHQGAMIWWKAKRQPNGHAG